MERHEVRRALDVLLQLGFSAVLVVVLMRFEWYQFRDQWHEFGAGKDASHYSFLALTALPVLRWMLISLLAWPLADRVRGLLMSRLDQ